MVLYIARILTVLLASLYFFPLNLSFLPADLNSKKLMAAIGLVIFIIENVRNRSLRMNRDVFICIFLACLVSLAGVFSVAYNNTSDMTYASYIMSMLVWLGAAYLVVCVIRLVEDRADVKVLGQYLVSVCVFQCVSALLIDTIPAFKSWTLGWMMGFGFTGIDSEASRMFGMGAFLDVGGTRFAAGLVVLAALIKEAVKNVERVKIYFYLLAFAFILIVGSMIGRTTVIGAFLALFYWLVTSDLFRFRPEDHHTIVRWLAPVILFVVIAAMSLYESDPYYRKNIHFAFENFFSLAETGSLTSTASTSRLLDMFVWPDNMKTWLIGDGYFNGPGSDPNFLGSAAMTDFYMWTDVGYCRFIFYFGLVGLGLFMLFFIHTAIACSRKNPDFVLMFVLLVLLNFVIWIKVSTDIFVMIAPFLCLDIYERDEDNLSPELDL